MDTFLFTNTLPFNKDMWYVYFVKSQYIILSKVQIGHLNQAVTLTAQTSELQDVRDETGRENGNGREIGNKNNRRWID